MKVFLRFMLTVILSAAGALGSEHGCNHLNQKQAARQERLNSLGVVTVVEADGDRRGPGGRTYTMRVTPERGGPDVVINDVFVAHLLPVKKGDKGRLSPTGWGDGAWWHYNATTCYTPEDVRTE